MAFAIRLPLLFYRNSGGAMRGWSFGMGEAPQKALDALMVARSTTAHRDGWSFNAAPVLREFTRLCLAEAERIGGTVKDSGGTLIVAAAVAKIRDGTILYIYASGERPDVLGEARAAASLIASVTAAPAESWSHAYCQTRERWSRKLGRMLWQAAP